MVRFVGDWLYSCAICLLFEVRTCSVNKSSSFNNLRFREPEPIWCLPFVTTQMVVLDNLESNQANSSKFMCYSFNGHNVDTSAVRRVSAVCCWVCWWAEYAGCPANASLWTVDCGTENVIWQHSPRGGRDKSGQCPVPGDHSPVTMLPSVEVSPCPHPLPRLLTQAASYSVYITGTNSMDFVSGIIWIINIKWDFLLSIVNST